MKKYQIWSEGYLATGMDFPEPAKLWGEVEAESFQAACDGMFSGDAELQRYYDRERLTVWGCRLFDNEADARRFMG